MKYSNLFFILALALVILPWTGFPFGFIRITITIIAGFIGLLSIGLFQREEKISAMAAEYRFMKNGKESVSSHKHKTVHRDESVDNLAASVDESLESTSTSAHKRLSDVM